MVDKEICVETSFEIKMDLTKDEKKSFGIFFTPELIVDELISNLPIQDYKTILEPSCGDGRFFKLNITKAYELNEKVFNEVSRKFPLVNVVNEDYLTSSLEEKFDLIIGNPPYFIYKSKLYNEYFSGRTNIFIQFIIHSLKS